MLGFFAAPYLAFAALVFVAAYGLGFGWIFLAVLGTVLALLAIPAAPGGLHRTRAEDDGEDEVHA
ncbi:MAG: hypothetical protein R3E96_01640 [Planctomycetota bacterium]